MFRFLSKLFKKKVLTLEDRVMKELSVFISENGRYPKRLFIVEELVPSKNIDRIYDYRVNYRKNRRFGKEIYFK